MIKKVPNIKAWVLKVEDLDINGLPEKSSYFMLRLPLWQSYVESSFISREDTVPHELICMIFVSEVFNYSEDFDFSYYLDIEKLKAINKT